MASRMRSARKRLRKRLFECVDSGNGNAAVLEKVAREVMGREVGIEEVTDYFYRNETANAMQQLRLDGQVETVGGLWLKVTELTQENVEMISVRSLSQLRGRAKAQVKFAHEHGRIEEACAIARLVSILDEEFSKRDEVVEAESQVAT